jgi:hypothetical protein
MTELLLSLSLLEVQFLSLSRSETEAYYHAELDLKQHRVLTGTRRLFCIFQCAHGGEEKPLAEDLHTHTHRYYNTRGWSALEKNINY